jgi:hypothetical protein
MGARGVGKKGGDNKQVVDVIYKTKEKSAVQCGEKI